MKPIFSIVYIRIISLRWKFEDHPLVEYPLWLKLNIFRAVLIDTEIPLWVRLYDIGLESSI